MKIRISCEICGASTTDKEEIEKAKKNNFCPVCLHIGSLYIDQADHPTEKGGEAE